MEKIEEVKPNILVVDDVDTNLILFEANFSTEFNVTMANSGKKALELLKQKNYAVIISDQRMPEMSGIELLEMVKISFPDTMRFIITAYTDYEIVVEAINKGEIYGFFNKPYDRKAVKLALNKAIEVYNLRNSNKKMFEVIERTNRELRDFDRSKTRYLNNLTNEIRTPINKIISAVHMLKDRIGSNDLSDLLIFLDSAVSRLESFSSAANLLVRLSEENISAIELKDVSLRELVQLSIFENKNLLDESQTTPDLIDDRQEINIMGDRDLLITCFSNLLINSLKHVERNGNLKISYGLSGDDKYIEIIDQGINYSGSQLDDLVNYFSDIKRSDDYMPGIELILAKQIMRSHGGCIILNMNKNKSVSTKMVFPVTA